MDADVYGPSIPHLLGVNERPTAVEGRLQPVVRDGLRVMSMGFLVPPAKQWFGGGRCSMERSRNSCETRNGATSTI